jgi:hypothetical protein
MALRPSVSRSRPAANLQASVARVSLHEHLLIVGGRIGENLLLTDPIGR